MKRFSTVAIVGTGLVGGSIGLALRRSALAEKIIGIGRRQASLRVARRVGAVTNTTVDLAKGVAEAELVVVCTPVGHIVDHVCQIAAYCPEGTLITDLGSTNTTVDLAKGVAEAELVVVCTPVGQIVDHVRQIAAHCPEGTLITDVGSTKQTIVAALDGGLPRDCRFLGGHPLAGSEKSGAGNASADLFDGRLAILTPTRNTRAEDFDLLEKFWQGLGSVVVQMSAEEHDRALAITSHLPHVVAAALAAAVPESLFRLSGTGLLDTTRLAAGDPVLWRQILTLNRRYVLSALEQYGAELAALQAAVRDDNQAELERLLSLAKKNRDALGS